MTTVLASSIALSNRGLELLARGDPGEALRHFDAALAMDPQSAPSHFNRAVALGRLGRNAEEVVAYDAAIASGLDIGHAHHNRAIALLNLGRFEEALQACDRAVRRGDDSVIAIACNTRGLVLQELRRYPDARTSFAEAVRRMPDYPAARLNHGIASLMLGDYADGWAGYEYRWLGAREAATQGFAPPATDLPLWDGAGDGASVRLLVYCEQGLGDTLQFCRFLPAARRRVADLALVCPPSLQRLLTRSFPDMAIYAAPPPRASGWSHQVSLMSLPHRLGVRIADLGGMSPYLRSDSDAVRQWRTRLDTLAGSRPRLGLVWAGSARHHRDHQRSLPAERVIRLIQDARFHWVSLQTFLGVDDRFRIGAGNVLLDPSGELQDFAATADLVAALDGVVAVDTAVAHLAGALGKPVWLLNRYHSEWRWQLDREESPWYASLQILSQRRPGDWDEVLGRLPAVLDRFFLSQAA